MVNMKKFLKPVLAVTIALTLLIASAATYFADTYSIYDGYRYTTVNWKEGTVAFCGVTDETAEEITVPDKIGIKTVVEIDDYAFYNNTVLKAIDLSQTEHLYYIAVGAFRGCTALESLETPDTMQFLGEYMLTGCSSLKSLTLGGLPVIIPDEMCNRCTSLETVNIPDSVTEIRRYAFGNCTSLTDVEIPASVLSIDVSAFYNCPNLVIHAPADSYAYQFALDNGINVVATEQVILGDVNLDKVVNVRDVTLIQRYAAEFEDLTPLQITAADIDGNGVPGMNDATELQRFIAEFDVDYPIGELVG